jgi:hypothetical protein
MKGEHDMPPRESRDRRPRPVTLLLAASTAAIAGGTLYATLRTPAPPIQPTPVPAPTPSSTPALSTTPSPSPSSTPVDPLIEATNLRVRARDALNRGDPTACLVLLERARTLDRAGDASPDVTTLRSKAQSALKGAPH